MNTPTSPAAASVASSDGAAAPSRLKDNSFRTTGSPIDAALAKFRQASVSAAGVLIDLAAVESRGASAGTRRAAPATSSTPKGEEGEKSARKGANEVPSGGGSPARQDSSVTRTDTETPKAVRLIEEQTLKLEQLNVLETQLHDNLMASLDPNNMGPPAQRDTDNQQQPPGWHLVHGGGLSKKRNSSEKGSEDGIDSDGEDGQPRKRVFSKYDEETTSILTEWFLAHKRWPYPASKEKDALAKATNLTTLQISNWFTNKRKRHWTPVIKKRTRSPRDFFEFCVMNPKEALVPLRNQQSHQLPQHHQHLRHHANLSGMPSHPHAMGGMHHLPPMPPNDMHLANSHSNHHPHRSYSAIPRHNHMTADPFDTGRGPSGTAGVGGPMRSHRAVMQSTPPGWGPRGAPHVDAQGGGGGWLDHSRAAGCDVAPGGAGPGGLAPGLVYASKAARQAANMDDCSAHHHMMTEWSQRAAMEQRSQDFSYDGSHRAPQMPGMSSGPPPCSEEGGMHGFDPAKPGYRSHDSYPPYLQPSVHGHAPGVCHTPAGAAGSPPGSAAPNSGGLAMWAQASSSYFGSPRLSSAAPSAYRQRRQPCGRQEHIVAPDQRYAADPGTPFYENYPIITGTSNGSPTHPTHHAVVSGAAAPPMASAASYGWRDAGTSPKQEALSRAAASDAGGGGAAAASVADNTAGTASSETSSIGNLDRRESGGGGGSSRPHGVTETTGGRKAGLKHEDGHQPLQQRERGELSGSVTGGAAAAGSGGDAARENNQQSAGGGGHRVEGAAGRVGGGSPTGIQKDGARSDQWR